MKSKLKNGLFILAIIVSIFGLAYSLHLKSKLETLKKRIRELQIRQEVLVHKDRLKMAEKSSDSLQKVINSFEPDTVFMERIKVKHDTVYLQVTKKTHKKQIEWVIHELDSLY